MNSVVWFMSPLHVYNVAKTLRYQMYDNLITFKNGLELGNPQDKIRKGYPGRRGWGT